MGDRRGGAARARHRLRSSAAQSPSPQGKEPPPPLMTMTIDDGWCAAYGAVKFARRAHCAPEPRT